MPTIPPDLKTLDLVTSCELKHLENADKKPVYHFLYGSQLYGTLFGVFGQFNGNVKGNFFEVTSIKLLLVNYQGLLNMGFAKAPTSFADNVVTFGVRGKSGDLETTVDLSTTPLLVEKYKRSRLIFSRELYPLEGFTVEKPDTELDPPNQQDEFFDTEFHYRSGIDHSGQYHRLGMAKTVDQKADHPKEGHQKESVRKLDMYPFPALRCVQSVVNLLYLG